MSGFIYAIGDETRVKIGWSSNPMRRLVKIASDCPDEIDLLGVVPATLENEAELHALLEQWRIGGEWFRRDGAVNLFVSMLGKPHAQSCEDEHPLRRWRRERQISMLDLAQRAGVSQGTLSKIECGIHEPSVGLAVRLSRVTGGEISIEEFCVDVMPEVAE